MIKKMMFFNVIMFLVIVREVNMIFLLKNLRISFLSGKIIIFRIIP